MQQMFAMAIGFAMLPVLLRRRVRLSAVLMGVGVVMGVISGLGLPTMARCVADIVVKPASVNAILTLLLIYVLGNLFKRYGMLNQIVDSFSVLIHNPKIALMLLPALTGLLPVPGGAYLSAPMVDAIGDKLSLDPVRKVSVNLTFRHLLYLLLPYSNTILLIHVAVPQIQLRQLFLVHFVYICCQVTVGYLLYLRPIPNVQVQAEKTGRWKALRDLAGGIFPLFLVLVLAVSGIMPIYAGVLTAVLATGLIYKFEHFWKYVREGIELETAVMLAGIYFVQNIISRMSDVLGLFSDLLLQAGGITMLLILCATSFFFSYATGIMQVPMSLTLPIIAILPTTPVHVLMLTVIATLWSFFGYYMSPLHLCALLTIKSIPCAKRDTDREAIRMIGAMMAVSWALYFGVIALAGG